jgi:hypothetical protein
MKIVRTVVFEKSLKKLGASKADIAKLESELAANPLSGDVIPGLEGARKVRFAMARRGKQGGGRAIYIVIWTADAAYLLLAYSKKDQADITEKQRADISALIKEIPDG